ncbi:MAG TPA: hypothetical protein VFY79_03995 [Dehalococcoidia bacterium]|nr:hypothetical protein [Dehalococcoidia bacterium]
MTVRQQIGRPNAASQARLQLVLVLLAAWDLLAFLLELGQTSLLKVGSIDGALGGRSVSGAVVVLAIAYLYAARNPIRYRIVLWLATLEQFIALFATAFHWARGTIGAGQAVIPILVAAIFLMLLMMYMPKQAGEY